MDNNDNEQSNNNNKKKQCIQSVAEDHEDDGYVILPKVNNNTDNKSATTKPFIYFNNAGQAMISDAVQQAGVTAITNQMPNAADAQSNVRTLFGQLLNTVAMNIAIMPCTAFAITLAATNIERSLHHSNDEKSFTGGRIVLLQDQMDSEVYPWQDICLRSNGKLQLDIVPYPTIENNETWTDLIVNKLNSNHNNNNNNNNSTPIVAVCIPPLHWSDGSYINIEKICQICNEKNIYTIVDVTQAAGAVPIDIQRLAQPTIVCCSIHKWLRGPSGASLVYISPSVQDVWHPFDQHGRSRDCYVTDPNYDAYKYNMTSTGYPPQFSTTIGARKFDSGGKPHPIILPMLQQSLQEVVQLNNTFNNTVQKQLQNLMEPFIEWINSKPDTFQSLNTDKNQPLYYHIIGIRPKNDTILSIQDLINISDQLKDEYGIYTAVRCGAIRISCYIDNTPNDVEQLISALQQCIFPNSVTPS